nr:gtp-binding protein rhoc [Quercus suber]
MQVRYAKIETADKVYAMHGEAKALSDVDHRSYLHVLSPWKQPKHNNSGFSCSLTFQMTYTSNDVFISARYDTTIHSALIAVQNYDHIRRKNSSRSFLTRNDSYRRSACGSDGTINTTSSGARTNITAPPEYSKKFVVVGDGGCGKTCLLISYSQGIFPEVEHKPSGKGVELALWDTAGQEEYDRLRPLSYPETDLLFVCFAIDCPNSLENVLDKWYPEVLHFCPTTPIILCGLKSDLRNKRTCIELLKSQGLTPVTQAQGKTVAQKMGALYMECSSKELTGVHEIFDTAIDVAVRGQDVEDEGPATKGAVSTTYAGQNMPVKKKKRSINEDHATVPAAAYQTEYMHALLRSMRHLVWSGFRRC